MASTRSTHYTHRRLQIPTHTFIDSLSNNVAAFAVVYGIFLSFGELGPGNCLGLLASKTSPTAVRGQYYGIAAAIGKVGAFVGTWAFPPIIDGEYTLFDSNKI